MIMMITIIITNTKCTKRNPKAAKCIHILFCRRYFGCEPIQIRGIDDEYYAKYDLGMYSIQMPKIVGIFWEIEAGGHTVVPDKSTTTKID